MPVVTVSSTGQIMLPQVLRQALGLQEGDQLEVTIDGDCLVLTRVSSVPAQPWQRWRGAWPAHKRCRRMWLTTRTRCAVSHCLDAFALLAWLRDEPGADITQGFLRRAANNQGFHCFVSAINVGEVYYRLYRVRGPKKLRRFGKKLGKGLYP